MLDASTSAFTTRKEAQASRQLSGSFCDFLAQGRFGWAPPAAMLCACRWRTTTPTASPTPGPPRWQLEIFARNCLIPNRHARAPHAHYMT